MKLQTIFWKEDGMYVIKEAATGVTTQGHTIGQPTQLILQVK